MAPDAAVSLAFAAAGAVGGTAGGDAGVGTDAAGGRRGYSIGRGTDADGGVGVADPAVGAGALAAERWTEVGAVVASDGARIEIRSDRPTKPTTSAAAP